MTPRPAERTTVRVLPRILAAALLAAACSDSVGPARAPAPPLFSFSAGGIALDQQNSAMGQPGRRFVKGFNPTNPQNGDAIVVTLFWVGQTNIVDSVTDHLVNNAFTKVGNTYNLVGYVTAGGISMATFVATNVQNIPLANPNGEDVLAIVADLHDSVPDGGAFDGPLGVVSAFAAGSTVSVCPGAILSHAPHSRSIARWPIGNSPRTAHQRCSGPAQFSIASRPSPVTGPLVPSFPVRSAECGMRNRHVGSGSA